MIRIMLIDDHGVLRDGLRSLFDRHSDLCIVGEAESGEQGLALMASKEWDLLLLDINLPYMNGLEVLRQMRVAGMQQPVLVLTMYQDFHLARRAMQAGANGFIEKSRLALELVHAIHVVFAGGTFLTEEYRNRFAASMVTDQAVQPHDRLSAQEYNVLLLIGRGYSVSRIAEELQLSPSTITTYRRRIKEKLAIEGSTADLVRYAVEHGLLT
ncbi:MAG: response regulator transcription factor [Magnetococcales bacterium]|nr:response regulator transcription factor [Magnetococcales bacterium]